MTVGGDKVQHHPRNSNHLVQYCSITVADIDLGYERPCLCYITALLRGRALVAQGRRHQSPPPGCGASPRVSAAVSGARMGVIGACEGWRLLGTGYGVTSGGQGRRCWEGRGLHHGFLWTSRFHAGDLLVSSSPLSSLMAISMAARLQNRDVFLCRSESTIRLPAASRKRLLPVVPFTALFFFLLFFFTLPH